MINRLHILILLVCVSAGCFAQSVGSMRADSLLDAINSRFGELDALIFNGVSPSASPYAPTLKGIDSLTQRETAIDAAIANRVDAEIAEFKSDLGVKLTGQTYYRLDGAIGFDEEDPQSRYNGKVQIEARWYFLQSSLFNRAGNIKAIELQGDIDRTLRERDRLDLSVYRQKEMFRHINDSLLAGVLRHHITNLSLLTEANLYLLESGSISSDELLKLLDDKAEAERMLATLTPGMPAATDLSGIEAFTVEVDTASLMRYIHDTAVDMRLLQLQMKLLEQQEANTSYWTDCNIAPFVRYSYYTRRYAPNSSNVDAGVSFTVPIDTRASHRRRTLQAQRQVLEAESVGLLQQVTDRIAYYTNEIDRLNRASVGEVRRLDELKGYLTVRARGYDNSSGGYNRLSRLKEYNNYLTSLERLVTFQYQRDCYVADLQRLLTTGSILDFCHETRIVPQPHNRTLSTPND